MTFEKFYRFFNIGYGDDLVRQFCPRFMEYRQFAYNYVEAQRRETQRWSIPIEEVIAAWYVTHPDERLLGDLTIAELKSVFPKAQ